jgi:glutaminase
MDLPSIAEQAERPHVSTGHLPEAETLQKLASDAHRRVNSNTGSENSQVYPAQVYLAQVYLAQVYPALARLPCESFGACVAGAGGSVCAAEDTAPAPLTLLAPN